MQLFMSYLTLLQHWYHNLYGQIIGFPMGSDPAPFSPFCFYESKWMNKIKKNDLLKKYNW